jgi:Flp pilus assembly protein TadD
VLRAAQVELELRAKDYEKAIALARRYQAELPASAELRDLEAAAQQAKGDRAAALAAAAEALRIEPTARRMNAQAQLLVADGRPKDAAAALQAWVQQHPEDGANLVTLALILQQNGEARPAVAAYEQALAKAPENASLLNNLAVLYQELGDPRAAATAKRAYDLAPERPEIVDTYGWILVEQGRVQEGLVLLQQAFVTSPQHPEIAYHVAVALSKAKRAGEAKPILERIAREHPGTPFAEKARAMLASP